MTKKKKQFRKQATTNKAEILCCSVFHWDVSTDWRNRVAINENREAKSPSYRRKSERAKIMRRRTMNNFCTDSIQSHWLDAWKYWCIACVVAAFHICTVCAVRCFMYMAMHWSKSWVWSVLLLGLCGCFLYFFPLLACWLFECMGFHSYASCADLSLCGMYVLYGTHSTRM